MISLTTTWTLKDGCPPTLRQAPRDLAVQVRAHEPGTWAYLVHLQAPSLFENGKLADPAASASPRPGASRAEAARPRPWARTREPAGARAT